MGSQRCVAFVVKFDLGIQPRREPSHGRRGKGDPLGQSSDGFSLLLVLLLFQKRQPRQEREQPVDQIFGGNVQSPNKLVITIALARRPF
jgi:hypothetical protein